MKGPRAAFVACLKHAPSRCPGGRFRGVANARPRGPRPFVLPLFGVTRILDGPGATRPIHVPSFRRLLCPGVTRAEKTLLLISGISRSRFRCTRGRLPDRYNPFARTVGGTCWENGCGEHVNQARGVHPGAGTEDIRRRTFDEGRVASMGTGLWQRTEVPALGIKRGGPRKPSVATSAMFDSSRVGFNWSKSNWHWKKATVIQPERENNSCISVNCQIEAGKTWHRFELNAAPKSSGCSQMILTRAQRGSYRKWWNRNLRINSLGGRVLWICPRAKGSPGAMTCSVGDMDPKDCCAEPYSMCCLEGPRK